MFIKIIVLLTLILVIVGTLWIVRFVFLINKKNQENIQLRDRHLLDITKRVNEAIIQTIKIEQFIVDYQNILDKKLDELSRSTSSHNSIVVSQLEKFNLSAKSDMIVSQYNELIRSKELLAALKRIIGMTTMSRQSPAAIDVLAIESVTNRIKELEMILEEEYVLKE